MMRLSRRTIAFYTIMRELYDTPANGAAGIAIKAYMLAFDEHADGALSDAGTPLDRYDPEGRLTLDLHVLKGVLSDAVRFVPELRPLVAGIVDAPSRLPPPITDEQFAELRARAEAIAAEFDPFHTPRRRRGTDRGAPAAPRVAAARKSAL